MWIKCRMKRQIIFLKVTGVTMEQDNPSQYSIVVATSDREFSGIVVKRVRTLENGRKILKSFENAILNGGILVDLTV